MEIETKIIESRFGINNIAYEVVSDDEGGVHVIYHTVRNNATLFSTGKEFVEGVETPIKVQYAAINTDRMNVNEFIAEGNFCTLDELPATVMSNINKRKLY